MSRAHRIETYKTLFTNLYKYFVSSDANESFIEITIIMDYFVDFFLFIYPYLRVFVFFFFVAGMSQQLTTLSINNYYTSCRNTTR